MNRISATIRDAFFLIHLLLLLAKKTKWALSINKPIVFWFCFNLELIMRSHTHTRTHAHTHSHNANCDANEYKICNRRETMRRWKNKPRSIIIWEFRANMASGIVKFSVCFAIRVRITKTYVPSFQFFVVVVVDFYFPRTTYIFVSSKFNHLYYAAWQKPCVCVCFLIYKSS